MMTTQTEVREAFFDQYPQFKRRAKEQQNEYPTDVRCAFVDFVDALARDGEIPEALAARVTL